jgi:benzil reductase ((S)-benzoin forming)
MDYYIITGTSRGIGEALAHKVIEPGNTLFAISRTLNEDLVEYASSLQVPIFYSETDLSDRESAENFIHGVFEKIHLTSSDRIALINNAGILEPVSPIKSLDFLLLEKHFNINLLAPFILSSVFLAKTSGIGIPKVILNISSGAASYPYSGWGVYCSSKAALDMITRVSGLEQATEPFPATIFALAPGIIETSMQESIRKMDENLFPERHWFIDLFENGKLSKPEEVADIIIKNLFDKSIKTGSILSIDQLKK